MADANVGLDTPTPTQERNKKSAFGILDLVLQFIYQLMESMPKFMDSFRGIRLDSQLSAEDVLKFKDDELASEFAKAAVEFGDEAKPSLMKIHKVLKQVATTDPEVEKPENKKALDDVLYRESIVLTRALCKSDNPEHKKLGKDLRESVKAKVQSKLELRHQELKAKLEANKDKMARIFSNKRTGALDGAEGSADRNETTELIRRFTEANQKLKDEEAEAKAKDYEAAESSSLEASLVRDKLFKKTAKVLAELDKLTATAPGGDEISEDLFTEKRDAIKAKMERLSERSSEHDRVDPTDPLAKKNYRFRPQQHLKTEKAKLLLKREQERNENLSEVEKKRAELVALQESCIARIDALDVQADSPQEIKLREKELKEQNALLESYKGQIDTKKGKISAVTKDNIDPDKTADAAENMEKVRQAYKEAMEIYNKFKKESIEDAKQAQLRLESLRARTKAG